MLIDSYTGQKASGAAWSTSCMDMGIAQCEGYLQLPYCNKSNGA